MSYVRISDDTEGDQHGVIDQLGRNEANAERLGATVVERLEDNDKSASKATVYRDDFERMIRYLAKGRLEDGTRVDGVIVVEQSRIARTQTDWERYSEALVSAPNRVHVENMSVMDPYSDAFDLHGTFGTYTNKTESRKIKFRTKASHVRRAGNGIPVGGTLPFGWNPDRVTLDPEKSVIAREIVREYLSGRTLHGIVNGLRERGCLTTKGNPWTTDALRKYLANPRLCGWRMFHGEIVLSDKGEPVVGNWEPLVSVEEWQAVERRLRAGRRLGQKSPGTDTRRHLLSGFLRCGKCGALLRAMPRSDVTGGLLYGCAAKPQGGCGGIARNARVLEGFLVEAVLTSAEGVAAQRAEEEGPWPHEEEYEAAEGRRTALHKRWATGRLSDESYFDALDEIDGALRALRADRQAWSARAAAAERISGSVREEWERREGQLDWRRAFLADHLRSVVVLPVGGGRRPFNPEQDLRLLWRED